MQCRRRSQSLAWRVRSALPIIPESAAELGASIFHSLRLRQAECGHLFAIQDFCGRFYDSRVEGRGTERDPFAERLDFGLFNGRRGGPRDAEPAKRRGTKQSLSFRRARQQLREENVYLPVVASAWIPRRVRSCAGFRTPAVTSPAHVRAAGVGKAPRHEIAGSGGTVGAAGSMGI
jgi:hypothetical protein